MSKKIKKKVFRTKRSVHNRQRYDEERLILTQYGLNNKKEYYKYVAMAQSYRSFFRRTAQENSTYGEVFTRLRRLNILTKDTLDINDINSRAFLERRLQTILARQQNLTIKAARQKITHRKVKVAGTLKSHCSFLVRSENESLIQLKA